MRRRLLVSTAALCFITPRVATAQPFRKLEWHELMPNDWDPLKEFRDDKNLASIQDGTPQALRMMRRLREVWDNAPTVAALDNAAVKLPGHVVPLEGSKGHLKEFLLVPYFGACIHTPPPPANQIVHVYATPPAKGLRAMDTAWVSGRLKSLRSDSAMGTSGYRLDATLVERIEAAAR